MNTLGQVETEELDLPEDGLVEETPDVPERISIEDEDADVTGEE